MALDSGKQTLLYKQLIYLFIYLSLTHTQGTTQHEKWHKDKERPKNIITSTDTLYSSDNTQISILSKQCPLTRRPKLTIQYTKLTGNDSIPNCNH